MAKILCIDDDQDILETCKILLKGEGHSVETAMNGGDGLKKARSYKPELIILDVMMEDTTAGFHTAYEIRKDESIKHTPILMLTSVNEKTGMKFDPKKDGAMLPVDEFLEKPIIDSKLISSVKKLLKLKKTEINIHGH